MEIETAVRRYLLNAPTVGGMVQTRVYKHRLDEPIDGTGKTALVVMRAPGWAAPDTVQTTEFPVVVVDVHADPSRTIDGDIATLDAEDKGMAMYRVLKPLMHGRRGEMWGAFGSNPGLMVVTCVSAGFPMLIRDADRHGGGEGALGDTVITRTRWNLCVAPAG